MVIHYIFFTFFRAEKSNRNWQNNRLEFGNYSYMYIIKSLSSVNCRTEVMWSCAYFFSWRRKGDTGDHYQTEHSSTSQYPSSRAAGTEPTPNHSAPGRGHCSDR